MNSAPPPQSIDSRRRDTGRRGTAAGGAAAAASAVARERREEDGRRMHLLPPQQQPSPLPRARWWWRPECIGSQRRTSCQGRRNRHILRKRVKLGGVWRSISCAFRHCDSSESHLDSVLNSLSFIRCLPIFAGTDLSLVKQAAGSSASSVFAQLQTLNLRLQTSVLCVCARTAKPSHSRLQTKMHELSRRQH